MAREFRTRIDALAGGRVPAVALTDGATVTPDCSKGTSFSWAIGGNRTLANPTNLADGMTVQIRVTQDATGGRTITLGSMYKFPGGAPSFSTAANAVDLLTGTYYADTGVILCGLLKGLS